MFSSKPQRIGFVSNVLKSLNQSIAKERENGVEEAKDGEGLSDEGTVDKWTAEQKDTVTALASSSTFIAWATQGEYIDDKGEKKTGYCLFLKRQEHLVDREKEKALGVSQLVQDIAFDNVKTPSKLVAITFDSNLYFLHLNANTDPMTIQGWTKAMMLDKQHSVPTSVSICRDLFQVGATIDLVGIGFALGKVIFFHYNAEQEDLKPIELKTSLDRDDKVLDVEFLRATDTGCRCGRTEQHFHAVIADKSGLLSVFLITGTDHSGSVPALGLYLTTEFEQKMDLNVESGDIVAASEKGNRFAVACGDAKVRIFGLAVGEGHKFSELQQPPLSEQLVQIPKVAMNNIKQFGVELVKTYKGLKAAWKDDYTQIPDSDYTSSVEKESIYMWQQLYTFDIGGVPLSVSISGDGKVVAVGKEDSESAVYDVDSGCKINSFKSDGRVRTVGLDAYGTKLLVGGFDRKLRQYHLQAGFEQTTSFRTLQGNVQSVSLDDAGQYIAIGTTAASAFLFSLDPKLSGSSLNSPVQLNISETEPTNKMENVVLHVKSSKLVYVVKLSADGAIFAYGDYNNHAKFFHLPSIKEKKEMFPADAPTCFFKHGQGFDEGHTGPPGFIWGLDIKMDDESYFIAVGSWKFSAHLYKFKKADFESSAEVAPDAVWHFPQKDRVFDVALSDLGSILVVGGRDETVKLYDMEELKKATDLPAAPEENSGSYLRNLFISKNSSAKPLIVAADRAFETLSDPDKVYCVAISPDGKYFAYGGVTKTVNVHQLGKHKGVSIQKQAFVHQAIVHRVKFIDNKHLAAISEDGRCCLYAVASKVAKLQLALDGMGNSLAFSSDPFNHLLAVAHGHSVSVFGKKFGFGPLDRPSVQLAKNMMDDSQSLQIALGSHPTLTNAFESSRKSLLSYAVEKRNKEAVDILLNSEEPSGLIMQLHMDGEQKIFTSPLTMAILNKDRNAVEKILAAINSKKISHTEGLFIKGFFSAYRKGQTLAESVSMRRPSSLTATEEEMRSYTKRSAAQSHTAFEDIAELAPASLLKFLANFELEECEPEVLKDLETAVISSRVYVGHPFRSPTGFWRKYYDEAISQKFEESFSQTTPECLVEAMRIPIPGMCGSTSFESGDDTHSSESFIPLEVIVDASTSLKNFGVFGKGSIVHALVMFQWTIIGPYFRMLFYQYLVYLFICVWLSWSLSYLAGTFHPVPFFLAILLFIISLRYLMREINQFIVEFKNQHHPSAGKRLRQALKIHFWDLWNMIDISAFTAQIVTDIIIIFFPFQYSLVVSWAAVAILLLFLKVFFYARAFTLFGPFVRMIQRTMSGMSNFLLVMLIFILGFALAFNVLLNDVDGFTSITDAMLSTLLMVYGDFSALENDDFPETNPTHFGLSTVLFNVMNLFCTVTMLNLLVAILSDNYEEVNEHAAQEYVAQLANIIVETQKMDKDYCDVKELAFRKWVHVLKPVPTQSIVEDASEMSAFKKDITSILTELKENMDNLNEKVDLISKHSDKQLEFAQMQKEQNEEA